ncbi:MAG: protein-L-isoaspartate O-methyltransferase [Spirochaetales bacterium]|nr:protein-L-isoaspartate O-methyltransferase [Spirochaetales bacterium]
MNKDTETDIKPRRASIAFRILFFGLALVLAGAGYAQGGDDDAKARDELVDVTLKAKGVTNRRVLEAIRSVPRRLFLPEFARAKADADAPLPLGGGQFDPAPSLVARIAEAIDPTETESVLVVGAGSGYLCAVFSRLSFEVFVTDVDQTFLYQAMASFESLKLANVQARLRDGAAGWDPPRLFDAIVVNGSVNRIPGPLVSSLRLGGKMIVPLGDPLGVQSLVLVTKTEEGLGMKSLGEVIFPRLKGRSLEQADKNLYPFRHEDSRDVPLTHFRPAPRRRRPAS